MPPTVIIHLKASRRKPFLMIANIVEEIRSDPERGAKRLDVPAAMMIAFSTFKL